MIPGKTRTNRLRRWAYVQGMRLEKSRALPKTGRPPEYTLFRGSKAVIRLATLDAVEKYLGDHS